MFSGIMLLHLLPCIHLNRGRLRLEQDPVRCAEMPQEARICFMRINTGELLVEAGFPLLRALTSLDDSIAVVNFGLWHQDETIYRQLLSQVASQVGAWNDAGADVFLAVCKTAEIHKLMCGAPQMA